MTTKPPPGPRKPYKGRTGAQKPPQDIWDEMGSAGAAGDGIRLGLAQARYRAWLDEQGVPYRHEGTRRPDQDDQ